MRRRGKGALAVDANSARREVSLQARDTSPRRLCGVTQDAELDAGVDASAG